MRKQQKLQQKIHQNLKACLLHAQNLQNLMPMIREEEEDSREDALLCLADMLQVYCSTFNKNELESLHGDGKRQQTGNDATVGYLLNLIAFARKFGRAILSLTILCCIILFAFQFDNASQSATSTITPLDDDEAEHIPPPGAFE